VPAPVGATRGCQDLRAEPRTSALSVATFRVRGLGWTTICTSCPSAV